MRFPPWCFIAFPCATWLLANPALADQVLCHYTYGGETKTLAASPVASPYGVRPVQVGSYFKFRVVFQDQPAAIAGIKVYTYSDRADGPVLIHQATYPYPPIAQAVAGYGFSGVQNVYETMRDGELQYWCEMKPAENSKRRRAP